MAESSPYLDALESAKKDAMGARLGGTVAPEDIDRANKFGVDGRFARDQKESLENKDNEYLSALNAASPKTLSFLRKYPVEDAKEVSAFERVGQGIDKGNDMLELVDLRWRWLTGTQQNFFGVLYEEAPEWTEADQKRMDELTRRMNSYGIEWSWDNLFDIVVQESATQIPIQGRMLRESGKGALGGAAVGAGVAAGTGQVGPQGMVIAGAGAKAGAMISIMRESMKLEGMLALNDMMQDPSIDPETAVAASIMVGVLGGSVEVLGGPEQMIPDSIRMMISRKGMKTLLKSATIRNLIKDVGLKIAKSMFTEGGEEGLQEFIQIVGDEMARMQSGFIAEGEAPNPTDLLQRVASAESLTRIGQSVALGAVATGPISTVYSAPDIAQGVSQVKRARQLKADFNAAVQRANASSTIMGSEAAREELTSDSYDVYVSPDAWTRYFQGQNIDPRQAAAEVLGDTEAYDQAVETGSDLAIPAKRYNAKLLTTEHHSGIVEDIRLSPDAMTYREASAYMRDLVDQDMKDPLLEEMTTRLIDAGYRQEDAVEYAELFTRQLYQMAERTGEDPMEMFEKYGGQVTNEGLKLDEDAILNQEVPSLESGATIDQDFGDLTLRDEYEVEETGETVTVEDNAQRVWEQTSKRRNVAMDILKCLG